MVTFSRLAMVRSEPFWKPTFMCPPAPISVRLGPKSAPPEAVREFLESSAREVEKELRRLLPIPSPGDGGVASALRYTALAPGKRVRPALTLAVADLFGVPRRESIGGACAIEMVHACSLILDDLPCMDDADLRRGLPANHRVHGEATAVLAAFALLNEAYGLLAGGVAEGGEDNLQTAMARSLSRALGIEGVIGGQALDLVDRNAAQGRERLERIHALKTASLFIASVDIGAVLGRATLAERQALNAFAQDLGLAYQICDDLLDGTDPGSPPGEAASVRHRNPVPRAGSDEAKRRMEELAYRAVEHLTLFGSRALLLAGLALHATQLDR